VPSNLIPNAALTQSIEINHSTMAPLWKYSAKCCI